MLHRSPIEISRYDPAWPEQFESERASLLELFDPGSTRIEHIGSTAVPGLGAKPIIDIMLGVGCIADVERHIQELEARDYSYHPEHEAVLPERRFFGKPRLRPRRVHLHAVEYDTPFWYRHLLFRDHLCGHPELAERYFALKLRLAQEFDDDREGYTQAKTDFIEAAVASAQRHVRR